MTDQENGFGTWINNLEMNGGTIEGTSAANKGVGIAFQKLNMTAGKLVGNGKVAAIQLRADEKINDINSVFQIPEGYLSDEYEFQTYKNGKQIITNIGTNVNVVQNLMRQNILTK